MAKKIEELYKSRLESFTEQFLSFQRRSNGISIVRLLTVLFTVGFVVYGIKSHQSHITAAALTIGISLFIILIIYHEKVISRIGYLKKNIKINGMGIHRLENRWDLFEDSGEEFVDEEHSHSFDLDIFGGSSLYQYLTTAHTFSGRRLFAQNICGESVRGTIEERQDAVIELSKKIDFRQNLEAAAMDIEREDPEPVYSWFETVLKRQNPLLIKVVMVLPLVSFIAYLSFKFLHTSGNVHLVLYVIQLTLFLIFYKKSHHYFPILSRHKKMLLHYSSMIRLIEEEQFSSPLLKELQSNVVTAGKSTFQRMKRLNGIIQKSDIRFNPLLHFVVNALTLWDLRIIHEAEKWKREHGASVRSWITTIAEYESLCSLAIAKHANPEWTVPEINDSVSIDAEEIRHPLIPSEKSIGNSCHLNSEEAITIISGSNMSGKSTYLRTVAINLLLAYAGAPVAAKRLSCGRFEIITAMRNSDNVAKHISTFYAELLRIRTMVEKVNTGTPVFFVIDEIFSGTNSRDRITGAFALLKELNCANSLGMISTHDLELCALSDEKDYSFSNYHFKEYYRDNRIHFDYTLYPGPSTTSNALYLMKMVGITIGE